MSHVYVECDNNFQKKVKQDRERRQKEPSFTRNSYSRLFLSNHELNHDPSDRIHPDMKFSGKKSPRICFSGLCGCYGFIYRNGCKVKRNSERNERGQFYTAMQLFCLLFRVAKFIIGLQLSFIKPNFNSGKSDRTQNLHWVAHSTHIRYHRVVTHKSL